VSNRIRWIAAILVTAILFTAISVSRPHYRGGQVEIKMAATKRTPVLLRWDSGEGFNTREQTTLVFGLTEPLPFEDHVLRIRNHGDALARTEEPLVLVRDIILDGSTRLNLLSLASPGDAGITEGGLLNVTAGGRGLTISDVFSSVEIVFVKGPFAGKAGIEVDDDRHSQELYETFIEPVVYRIEDHVVEGIHTLSIPLPRSDFLGIEMEPVEPDVALDLRTLGIETDLEAVDLPIEDAADIGGGLRFSGIDIQMKSFSALLVAVQLVVAAVFGAMFFVILSLPKTLGMTSWSATLRYLVVDDQRWIWWLLFLSTTGVFTFWLLGQWPGAMQNDSFAQWTQLKTLEINNVLPWMYTMAVLAATQVADTPATISVLQILASAFLGSTLLFFALRAGVSRAVIGVFWFLFTFSIPVGLYNVTMFKDVPFAQCTLLWAFIFYRLWMRKEDSGPMSPNPATLCGFVGLLMIFLIRHNGFLFVFAIPLGVLAVGLFERKRALQFVIASWLTFVVLQFGVANLIGAHERTDYSRLEFWMKAGPLFGLFANPGGYHTVDPVGDWQRIERFVEVETIKREYRRGSFEPLFYRHRSEDAGDVYRDLSALYDERSVDNAPILIGDKAYLFATIIGPFRGTYLWSNDLRERRFLTNRLWWNRRFIPRWGEMTMLHTLEHAPRSRLAYELQEKIWNRSREFAGVLRGQFVYWNAVVPFVLLIMFAAAYKWLPGTALFSIVVLFQVPFVAVAATAYHYRFIFFVHFCGFFVVPLALAEIRHRRARSTGETEGPAESILAEA